MPLIRFEAPLITINGWTIIKLPKTASAKLPSRGQVMAKGTMNNYNFQTALEPDGAGSHWLHIDEVMQKSTHLHAGDSAVLSIDSTKDWPEPAVPADWQAALRADKQIHELWLDVTPMARWEWLRWIGATSNQETRAKRINVACSKLMAGMRRPCCFNRSMCCVPQVSKNGVLLEPAAVIA